MMFRFRLQRVLEIRKRQEQRCHQEYAAAQAAHQSTLHKIEQNKRQLAKANLKTDALAQSNPTPMRHALHHQFKQRMQREEAELTLKATQQLQESIPKREALVQAHQRSEVLERLKSKKQAQYLRDQQRVTQIEMDEIAINTVLRNQTAAKRRKHTHS